MQLSVSNASVVFWTILSQQIEVNPPVVLGVNEHSFLDPC